MKSKIKLIKHIDEDGNEYWYARELQVVLEYAKWDKFSNVIEKAKEACVNSGFTVVEHFPQVGKTISMPKGAQKEVIDYKLSCYVLIKQEENIGVY